MARSATWSQGGSHRIAPLRRLEIVTRFTSSSNTRRLGIASGAGLALYLGREFARKVAGDLWVEETDGGGARFVVSLPNAAASAPKPAALEPSPAGA